MEKKRGKGREREVWRPTVGRICHGDEVKNENGRGSLYG